MMEQEEILALVSSLVETVEADLSPLGAAILLAVELEIAKDSSSFSKIFDVAHALVIRECVALDEELGAIAIDQRNERTQRLHYGVTEFGRSWLDKIR